VQTGIRLFGIDTPDVDPPESYVEKPFSPANHRLLLGNDVYIIENVGGEIAALLHQRVLLIPAPMKLGGEYASGAPVRLLATRHAR
jgi:kynurenine formamidase